MKQYLGANTGGSFSTEVWRATTRAGYPRGSNVASMTSTIDPAKLDEVLALDDWINLQDGYNYRQQSAVDTFFNATPRRQRRDQPGTPATPNAKEPPR
jgi:hypothetical protein